MNADEFGEKYRLSHSRSCTALRKFEAAGKVEMQRGKTTDTKRWVKYYRPIK